MSRIQNGMERLVAFVCVMITLSLAITVAVLVILYRPIIINNVSKGKDDATGHYKR